MTTTWTPRYWTKHGENIYDDRSDRRAIVTPNAYDQDVYALDWSTMTARHVARIPYEVHNVRGYHAIVEADALGDLVVTDDRCAHKGARFTFLADDGE